MSTGSENKIVTTVCGEVFAHFHKVAIKVTVESGMGRLTCQKEFFVNNPLDVKENDEHALDFALHLSCLFFGLSQFGLSVYRACLLPQMLV
jgi:hypothetical protein